MFQLSKEQFRKIAVVLATLTVLVIPLRVAAYGYLPPDDALRHAAFAMVHRNWDQILVLAPQFHGDLDSHPGWHAFLRLAHRLAGLDTDGLVVFSYIFSFSIFSLVGLMKTGKPLPWMLALGLSFVVAPVLQFRAIDGRPFIVSATVLTFLLLDWSKEGDHRPRAHLAVIWIMLTAAIWVHPTVWYVWIGVGLCLFICGEYKRGMFFFGGLVLALLTSALLVPNWRNIFVYPFDIVFSAFGKAPLTRSQLVEEFQPSGAPALPLVVAALLLMIRGNIRDVISAEFRKVDFVLFLGAWGLGLYVNRFFLDWSLPAFIIWAFRQLDIIIKTNGKKELIGVAAVSAMVYLVMTSDVSDRYSYSLRDPLLHKPRAEIATMLPERGGVLYSIRMDVFYEVFYRFPDAPFRYIVGFEPGLMPASDLDAMRSIQFNSGLLASYKPWLDKMTDKDRLFLSLPTKPEWPGFRFDSFYTYWVGRKDPSAVTH
ncbi:MAG TPA: hypothetical protein VFT72_13015 [Opitutaceae bacterium]|nr:hypothetical protein [Opitutaceae bacterium]